MSTIPGNDAWQDAGLEPVRPDEARRLGDDTSVDADPEEYAPGFGRGDLEGAADEADVLEQDAEVPDDDSEDQPQ